MRCSLGALTDEIIDILGLQSWVTSEHIRAAPSGKTKTFWNNLELQGSPDVSGVDNLKWPIDTYLKSHDKLDFN